MCLIYTVYIFDVVAAEKMTKNAEIKDIYCIHQVSPQTKLTSICYLKVDQREFGTIFVAVGSPDATVTWPLCN